MKTAAIASNLTSVEYDLALIDADHGLELVIEELLPAVFDVFRESDPVATADTFPVEHEHDQKKMRCVKRMAPRA